MIQTDIPCWLGTTNAFLQDHLSDKENFREEIFRTEDGSIIITAEKHEDFEDKSNKKYLRRERHSSSRIQRAFYLGDIDEDKIKANLVDGTLNITVPAKTEQSKKMITIE